MPGETHVNWRFVTSERKGSSKRRSDHRPRTSSSAWHSAVFRGVTGIPQQTSPAPPSPSPMTQRLSEKTAPSTSRRQKRRKHRPVPCVVLKDHHCMSTRPTVRCVCCCLPEAASCDVRCQCLRREHQHQHEPPLEGSPPQPSAPPEPPRHSDATLPRPSLTSHPSTPPLLQPSSSQPKPCCPCAHFLGRSSSYPSPEPNTWQFVYWPPMTKPCTKKMIHLTRTASHSVSPKASDQNIRPSRIAKRKSPPPRELTPTIQLPPKNSLSDAPACFCNGGWRCPCSKYELPEACVLAPIPPTSAPFVETTLLVPTSTKVLVPPATQGLGPRIYRVCMPPSELPLCHCPSECPCPHPRCPSDALSCPKGSHATGPHCSFALYPNVQTNPDGSSADNANKAFSLNDGSLPASQMHPSSDGLHIIPRPYVLFGRDPLFPNI